VAGPTAVVEFSGAEPAGLLQRAVERGLREYTPIVPTLADVYREVTQP